MNKLDKVLYTARAHTTGGRDGEARSDDGRLDVKLSSPGGAGTGTNPEQLFAAGYAACFHSALQMVARSQRIALGDSSVGARVGIGPNGSGGFGLTVALEVVIPEIEHDAAQALADAAHRICPYSNALRGNIDVTVTDDCPPRITH